MNLRVGAYANYFMAVPVNETLSFNVALKMSVDREETCNETLCWVSSMTTEFILDHNTTKMVFTWWLSKDKLVPLLLRMQTYMNDTLLVQQDIYPQQAPPEAGEPPQPIDPQSIVGYETIMVPAGMFANCAKSEVKTVQEGHTVVTDTWIHPDVPVFGIVKMEMYRDGKLYTTMELTSYGG